MAKKKYNYPGGGIYAIVNLKNGKRYVGQTYNFEQRWMKHLSCLNLGTHYNKILQADWDEYTPAAFDFQILEKCETVENLSDLEIKWIEKFNSMENGYNQSIGGKGIKGWKHTEEQIDTMRAKYNPKKVVQFSLSGEKIKVWPSATKAAKVVGEELGVFSLGIKACCENKKHTYSAGGYIWLYEDEADDLIEEYVRKCGKNVRSVEQIDLRDGSVVAVWPSINEAGRSLNMCPSGISFACSGKRKTAGGYGWRYAD